MQIAIRYYGFLFFPFLRAKYVRTLKGEINEHWSTANIKKHTDNEKFHVV